MNQQTVVIKSNKYGITLFLDKDTEFSELLKDIGEKFKASSKFFKDAQMAIAFEGRILSQEEQMDVIRVIQRIFRPGDSLYTGAGCIKRSIYETCSGGAAATAGFQ